MQFIKKKNIYIYIHKNKIKKKGYFALAYDSQKFEVLDQVESNIVNKERENASIN